MKRIKILLLLFFLASGFSVYATKSPTYNRNTNNCWGSWQPHRPPTCGVPLDGGILTILGAAGVAYFVARKKSKKMES